MTVGKPRRGPSPELNQCLDLELPSLQNCEESFDVV